MSEKNTPLTLHDYITAPGSTLRSALQQMTRNHCGVLFVCDEDTHLVGVLSDGDVRRSLLDDSLMVSPVAKLMNTDPVSGSSMAEAETLLKELAVVAVPVLNRLGQIEAIAVQGLHRVIVVTASPISQEPEEGLLDAVAIIPARGGSKRIPKKNLAQVAGRSLMEWTIRAAREARLVNQILVSTDDNEIAGECRRLGVEVPWMRPAEFSRDDSPTIAALEHAVKWAVENTKKELRYGVLLEPTAPMRQGQHIDDALRLLDASGADCVMSVCEVPHQFHPEEMLVLNNGQLAPYLPYRTMSSRKLRGEQSSIYLANGLVYAFRVESLLRNKSLYGERTLPLVTPWEEFVDIDTQDDLKFAELKMTRRQA